jgi:hypothetical protein
VKLVIAPMLFSSTLPRAFRWGELAGEEESKLGRYGWLMGEERHGGL